MRGEEWTTFPALLFVEILALFLHFHPFVHHVLSLFLGTRHLANLSQTDGNNGGGRGLICRGSVFCNGRVVLQRTTGNYFQANFSQCSFDDLIKAGSDVLGS
mmetsp:Transcript_57432/g.171323  ORF Transcript_57432/g.171323 Transcript_57432/m.171323 type:complete len:102 (-) Transcript_57432:87-392(-)